VGAKWWSAIRLATSPPSVSRLFRAVFLNRRVTVSQRLRTTGLENVGACTACYTDIFTFLPSCQCLNGNTVAMCSCFHSHVLHTQNQSFWLQIQRSGFDSRRYQIFREAVGLERGPLNLVSTIEELLEKKNCKGSGLENRDYVRKDS
jgi:hypothetical protein